MAKQYGEWKVVRSLSEGGQAHVYLVKKNDESDENIYVLKRLKNIERIKRFRSELDAYLKIDHPNIVKAIDYEIDTSKPYIVTEYYEHGHINWENVESWSTLNKLAFFKVICEAVGYAHDQDIIHRDIKPENIFIKKDGESPVIGDFGLCFFTEEGERITLTEEAVGSRNYIAPEVEGGRIQLPLKASDVYSLGKLLYWLFMGQVFPRERYREPRWNLTNKERDIRDTLMAELAFVNELLDSSVLENPDERFNNGRHFAVNVERTIFRIKRGAHVLYLNEFQICNFCGDGHYRLMVDTNNTNVFDGDIRYFGVTQIAGTSWMILSCNTCGHMQYFRTDNLQGNTWKK